MVHRRHQAVRLLPHRIAARRCAALNAAGTDVFPHAAIRITDGCGTVGRRFAAEQRAGGMFLVMPLVGIIRQITRVVARRTFQQFGFRQCGQPGLFTQVVQIAESVQAFDGGRIGGRQRSEQVGAG